MQHYYIYGWRSNCQDGWKASLPFPNILIVGSPSAGKPFDENAWELYSPVEDVTERVNLARKYPDRLASLKSLFEEQARVHDLYPLITWDNVLNGRFLRSKDSKSLDEEFEKLT